MHLLLDKKLLVLNYVLFSFWVVSESNEISDLLLPLKSTGAFYNFLTSSTFFPINMIIIKIEFRYFHTELGFTPRLIPLKALHLSKGSWHYLSSTIHALLFSGFKIRVFAPHFFVAF